VSELAVRPPALARVRARASAVPWFWVSVSATAAALAGVLGAYLLTWPPHEDEALALFTGRLSFPDLLHTVIAERGGAPLHFVLAWAVVHLGGDLTGLRVISAVFAVASVPAIAVLGCRLADRLTGAIAAVLASGTWVLLFHGVYGRMYSLFLFTSALSFIALLDALELGGRRRFALWGVATWLMLASHPYAVLVLAAQGLFVLVRRVRLRPALVTVAAVVVAAAPFWWADLVLRDRFDVGVGGGGPELGSPGAVLHYFWWVAGDMGAGHHGWSTPVLLLALAGFVLLAVRNRPSALLITCVVLVPGTAFVLAKLHSSASPEARHLIFMLPFFSTLLAAPLAAVGRLRPPLTLAATAVVVAALVVGEVRWADAKTPPLFHGDPPGETAARDAAARWLAAGARPDDVLLGYEPVYLRAWQDRRSFSRHAIARADPKLLADALKQVPEPLGRGVWVFDASDTTNLVERETIPFQLPQPASAFEGRAFGPYLVIRTREPLRTRRRFLDVSEQVMRLGRTLQIGDADINLHSLLVAESRFF
jgi:hypothetical protein